MPRVTVAGTGLTPREVEARLLQQLLDKQVPAAEARRLVRVCVQEYDVLEIEDEPLPPQDSVEESKPANGN